MYDNQDISYSHYDCKSYKKSKKYIETNRALMNEVGLKPIGRFIAVSNSVYKSEYKPKKNQISTLWQTFFVIWLAITLGFLIFKLGV